MIDQILRKMQGQKRQDKITKIVLSVVTNEWLTSGMIECLAVIKFSKDDLLPRATKNEIVAALQQLEAKGHIKQSQKMVYFDGDPLCKKTFWRLAK